MGLNIRGFSVNRNGLLEEVQAHYSADLAVPDPGSDMVEEGVIQMYIINMGGDARRWARELATSDFESLKCLNRF